MTERIVLRAGETLVGVLSAPTPRRGCGHLGAFSNVGLGRSDYCAPGSRGFSTTGRWFSRGVHPPEGGWRPPWYSGSQLR